LSGADITLLLEEAILEESDDFLEQGTSINLGGGAERFSAAVDSLLDEVEDSSEIGDE
jgi:hypothetical protein